MTGAVQLLPGGNQVDRIKRTEERTLWQYMTIVTINSNLLSLSLSVIETYVRIRMTSIE